MSAQPASGASGTTPAAPRDEVAVVAFGYELAGLFDGIRPITVVRDAAEAGLTELVEALRASLAGAHRVVVIHADWLEDDALALLQTARAALDTRRVALVPSDLPPLAGGALCVVAGAVAPYLVHAGRLVGALPAISAELVILAWLRSVSGLERPAPSMLQHVSSALPGRGFGVQVQPEPFIRRLDASGDVPVAPARDSMEVVIADRGGDPAWANDVVGPALGQLRRREVAPPEHGPRWWGTNRLTEIVAYPADIEALAARVSASTRTRACGWCETRVTGSPCPFCGHAG